MNELMELHPNFSYRIDVVGNEQEPVLVIDNFVRHAETLVDYAQTQAEFNASETFYPGVRATAPDAYIKLLVKHLGSLILQTFYGEKLKSVRTSSLYSMIVTPPEQLSPLQRIPHFDSSNHWDLATIHYLSHNENSGTSLYRHRATGFESIRPQRKEEYFTAVARELEKLPSEKKYMNGSNEHFEQIASYDSAFNRVLIYRCTNLHSGNIPENFNFDPNPSLGRLTLNTFLYAGKEFPAGLQKYYLGANTSDLSKVTAEA